MALFGLCERSLAALNKCYSARMQKIAQVLVKHSVRVLGLTAVITVLSVVMLTQIRFNADITSFLTEGNKSGQAFAALQEKYDAADPVMVLLERADGGSFRDKEGLKLLLEAKEALALVSDVAGMGSFLPETNPLTNEPITAELIEVFPPFLLSRLLDNPTTDLLLNEAGDQTLLMVLPAGDSIALARQLEKPLPKPLPEALNVTFAGNPVVFSTVISQLGWFLLAIPPLVIFLLVAVFYATIGDPRLALLAIVPAALGSIWTFGLMAALGMRIDIIIVIVPIFVIVMGSADGLHFVTHLQDAALKTKDKTQQISATLREVGVPMILTTVSTAAGFLSLLATDVSPIRQLGLFVAVGISFAGLISFFTLPALLSRLTIKPKANTAILGQGLTNAIKWAASRRWTALAFSIPLIIFAALGLPNLAVNPDQLFFFKDNHPVRTSFAKVSDVFGSATPLFGEFVYDPKADSGEQLERLRSSARELEALQGVRKVFSLADLVDQIPAGQRAGLLSGETQPPLGPMVSEDGLRFLLFPEDLSPENLQTWLSFAQNSPEVRLLSGTPVLFDEISRVVLRAQVVSLVFAFVLVALLLLLAYRRFGQTLVALIPLFLTTAVLLAFVAVSGIQLNLITAIISSIVIGVGIDYAIHLIAAIQHARPSGKGYVLRALDVAAKPILGNALGIALGMSALFLSPLKPHSQISAILWVAMITAALAALLIIPAFEPRDSVAP